MEISPALFALEESASTSSASVDHLVKELLGRYRTLLAEKEGGAPALSTSLSAASLPEHQTGEVPAVRTPVQTKVDLETKPPAELEKQ